MRKVRTSAGQPAPPQAFKTKRGKRNGWKSFFSLTRWGMWQMAKIQACTLVCVNAVLTVQGLRLDDEPWVWFRGPARWRLLRGTTLTPGQENASCQPPIPFLGIQPKKTKNTAKTTERGQSSMVQSSPQPSFTEAT